MEQRIERGRVVRGWMGVEILSVNEVIAQQYGLPRAEGVMINNVIPGGPAEKAGLKRGDVIVSFAGKQTPTQEVLVDLVGRTPPKTTVRIGVMRDGKRVELALATAEMPKEPSVGDSGKSAPPEGGPVRLDWEGARIVPLDDGTASRLGVPAGIAGVVVADLQSGGLADQIGLEIGDLISAINRQRTPSV